MIMDYLLRKTELLSKYELVFTMILCLSLRTVFM